MVHNGHTTNQFDAIIFDLDSTLVTIEGIDELARQKNLLTEVSAMTTAAMNGDIGFADVFFKRLDRIKPTKKDLMAVGHLYCDSITDGAVELTRELHKRRIQIFVVTGGYNPAVRMVTRILKIPDAHIFANEILFDDKGNYHGVNRAIPLWKNTGKKEVIRSIQERFPGRYALIGDSMSDLDAGALTDRFICYAGVAARTSVIDKSHIIISDRSLTRVLDYLS